MNYKKHSFLPFALLILLSLFSCKKESVTPINTCETVYYYSLKDKIFLEKSPTKISIGFTENISFETAAKLINDFNYFEKLEEKDFQSYGLPYARVTLKGYRDCASVTEILKFVKENKLVNFANQDLFSLRTKKKEYVVLTDEFTVGLKYTTDYPILQKFALENDVTLVTDEFASSSYLLKVNKTQDKDALEMANFFQESNLFYFAVPNLIVHVSNGL